MALDAGMGKLHQGMKNLLLRWDDTKSRWKDPVSKAFEEQHLETMEKQMATTIQAITRLAQAMQDARRACT